MSTRVESIAQPLGREEHTRLARRARNLSWLSLFVLAVEGTAAVTAGILANSIALIGFGIDSAIEAFASVIIVWRFTGARTLSEYAERRAQKLVALSFFLLAPYVAYEAIQSLLASEEPETSYIGIGIAVASALTMPYLGITKKRIGRRLGSRATEGEGTQNLLCAYLAVAVLVGLMANTLFGLWWLDPVVALLIAVVALQEGREAWEGEESGNGPSGIRRAGVTQPE